MGCMEIFLLFLSTWLLTVGKSVKTKCEIKCRHQMILQLNGFLFFLQLWSVQSAECRRFIFINAPLLVNHISSKLMRWISILLPAFQQKKKKHWRAWLDAKKPRKLPNRILIAHFFAGPISLCVLFIISCEREFPFLSHFCPTTSLNEVENRLEYKMI